MSPFLRPGLIATHSLLLTIFIDYIRVYSGLLLLNSMKNGTIQYSVYQALRRKGVFFNEG